MKKLLSPSVMCADLGNLRQEIKDLDKAGADTFHLDIMDGKFVPNFALSWGEVATIRDATNKPLDIHLMVEDLDLYLPYAYKSNVDRITIHYENGNSAKHLHNIRQQGIQAGLAINPETTLSEIKELLPLVDNILVMRVQPGFAGQLAIPEVEFKINQLTQLKNRNFGISLDGHVAPKIIEKWSSKGVEEFVCGTASGIFGKKRAGRSYAEIMKTLHGNNNDTLNQIILKNKFNSY